MNERILKINYVHLKGDIETNYLGVLDTLYKTMAMILNNYDNNISHLSNLVLENEKYHQLFGDLDSVTTPTSIVPNSKDYTSKIASIVLDMQIPLERLVFTRHNNNLENIYSLTIDSDYHCVITLKQFRRIVYARN